MGWGHTHLGCSWNVECSELLNGCEEWEKKILRVKKERMAPEILVSYIFTSGDKFAGWCVVGHVVATGKSRAPAGSGPSCNSQGWPLVFLPAQPHTQGFCSFPDKVSWLGLECSNPGACGWYFSLKTNDGELCFCFPYGAEDLTRAFHMPGRQATL